MIELFLIWLSVPSEVHKSCPFHVNDVKLLIESMFDGVIRSEGTIIQDRGHGSDLPIDGLKRLLLTCIACKHYQGTDIETVESTRGDVKGAS